MQVLTRGWRKQTNRTGKVLLLLTACGLLTLSWSSRSLFERGRGTAFSLCNTAFSANCESQLHQEALHSREGSSASSGKTGQNLLWRCTLGASVIAVAASAAIFTRGFSKTRSVVTSLARPAFAISVDMLTPCSRMLQDFVCFKRDCTEAPVRTRPLSAGQPKVIQPTQMHPPPPTRTEVMSRRRRPTPLSCIEEGRPLTHQGRQDHCKDEASKRQEPPHIQPPSNGSSTATPEARAIVPSTEELVELFKSLDSKQNGLLGLDEIHNAIPLLNIRFRLDLDSGDAVRLHRYLRSQRSSSSLEAGQEVDDTLISCTEFVEGVREVATVLTKLGSSMQISHLKTVLMAAFDKFDINGDGEISLDEFLATTTLLGLKLDQQDAATMHRFFAENPAGRDCKINVESLAPEPPLLEKWAATLGGTIKQMQDKYGWTSMENVAACAQEALSLPGSAEEKVTRALKAVWGRAEEVCDVAELATDAVGLAVAVRYMNSELSEVLTTGSLQNLDIMNVMPFAVCAGLFASNLAKELDELVPKEMSPDEALLYAQHFKKHGFSQAEFRRILSTPGCRWITAEKGDVLNDPSDTSIKIVVKGSLGVKRMGSPAKRAGVRLGPGASIGGVRFFRGRRLWVDEVITAAEPTLCISWDPAGLSRCLSHNNELSLRMDSLLAQTFAVNLRSVMQLRDRKSSGKPVEQDVCRGEASISVSQADTLAASLETQWCSLDNALMAMALQENATINRAEVEVCASYLDAERGHAVRTMFSSLESDHCGVVNVADLRNKMSELETCMKCLAGVSIEQALGLVQNGCVTKDDAMQLMPNLRSSQLLGTTSEDCQRLFAFVDAKGKDVVDLSDFIEKIDSLEGCLQGVGGLTLHELATLVRCAFSQFDANGDGQISADEFVITVRRLKLNLSEHQARMLHGYFDTNKDGAIDLGEWKPATHWLELVLVALNSQMERTGMSKVSYLVETLQEIMASSDDCLVKGQRLLARMWDGTNELVDVSMHVLDSVTVLTALSGVWQEISGVSSLQDVSQVDFIPFLLFTGISSVHMIRHLAEQQVTDLSERDALLYATVFEKHGFTVSEFQRLLSYGNTTWQTYEAGEAIFPESSNTDLRVVARGACELFDDKWRKLSSVSTGGFLGVVHFLEGNLGDRCPFGTYSRATELTTVITWDHRLLHAQLHRDDALRLKVTKALTTSMADRVLNAKETAS